MSSLPQTFDLIVSCSAMAFERKDNGGVLRDTVQKSPHVPVHSLLHCTPFFTPLKICERTAT